MKNRKRLVSILAGIMAAIMLLTLIVGLIPRPASAASSSEIRKQINELKEQKKEIQNQIKEVQEQYEQNSDEIKDIIARKNVIDQEVQLLSSQLLNINEQISAFNVLIADKQDELDTAQDRYLELNENTKDRIRAMEEDGSVSYWEVLFKARSISDFLDRMNMVEEIAASDQRRLRELADAADHVELAQAELEEEKADLEITKAELDATQAELDAKREEADALILELIAKAEDLQALEAEFEAQEKEFLDQIAQKELEYDEAKLAEWEAYMATYVPPTTAPSDLSPGHTNNSGGTNTGAPSDLSPGTSTGGNPNDVSQGTSGGSTYWMVPCAYSSITSPFGNRVSPTTGASTYHQGVDLDSTTGTPVVASRAGVVVIAGWGNAAGHYVKIDHRDGFSSIYMHLDSYSVSTGQMVSQGQQIGRVGATGITTGDHLHFGIAYNGAYVNPCAYVNLY